jgi:uncharacterized protein (TIGR00645 family)
MAKLMPFVICTDNNRAVKTERDFHSPGPAHSHSLTWHDFAMRVPGPWRFRRLEPKRRHGRTMRCPFKTNLALRASRMIEKYLARVLFASRWLLVVFLLALAVALLALTIKMVHHLFGILPHLWEAQESEVLIEVLGLIDVTFAAALIILVIFSSYENFVARIESSDDARWPNWMARIDFSGLKIKLMSAIIVISAIQLLRAFMDVEHTTDRELSWYAGIHMVFVVSAILLALMDRFSEERH